MKISSRSPRILASLLAVLAALSSIWLAPDATAATACSQCFAGSLACNESISGELDDFDCVLTDGTAIDIYSFTLTEQTMVTITLNSDDFDSWLFLLNASCASIAQNDDCVVGNINSCLTQSLAPGTYYVGANSYDPAIGTYTVGITCPMSTPPTLSIVTLPGGNVQVSSTAAGTLQATTALQGATTEWISIAAVAPGAPFETPASSPNLFYRLSIP